MSTPIRVLILEDRPADAELAIRELRRAGFDPDARRVDTEAGFAAALDSPPDLILADYQLPDWNGIKALVALQARRLDIPFIIVSGTIGEDTAVAAMRNGAEDFLIKDRLARLGPAVKQALERKRLREERKRTEKELRESEERFHDLFENANDLIQSVRPDGSLLYVNRAWRETLGYGAEEVAGLSMQDIIDPSCMSHCMAMFQRVMAGEKLPHVEAMFLTKDGRTIQLEGSSNCRFEDGQPVSTRSIFRNITERKQAGEHIRKLNRTYAVLSATNQLIVRERDPQTILDGACRIAVEKGGFRLGLITGAETQGEGLKIVAHAGATPASVALLNEIYTDRRRVMFSSQVYATGALAVCNDIEQDPLTASWRAAALERGYHSMVALPLKAGARVIGTVNLYADEVGFFDADELRLLGELAMDISFALEVSRQETQRLEVETALKQRAVELERFHQLSVGRELQMIELKKEVNEFATLAGRIPPHDLSFLEKANPQDQL